MTTLRSLAFNIWFFGVTLALALYGTALAPFRGAPMARALTRRWARLVVGGLRVLCDIRLEVRGLELLPADGPALLASHHESAFDTIVWLMLLPRCTYVMKHELRRLPLFGALTRVAGHIAVDRAGGAAALRTLARETERAVGAGRQIVIFPEGTRTAPGQVVPVQPGVVAIAARAGVPVIPVATDSGRHWGRRAFYKRPGTIHIHLLAPIPAHTPRAELVRRLEAAFAAPLEDCG